MSRCCSCVTLSRRFGLLVQSAVWKRTKENKGATFLNMPHWDSPAESNILWYSRPVILSGLWFYFQSSLKSWPTPGATRSCYMPGKRGTMNQVYLSRSTTKGLWSSATKPIEAMVRNLPLTMTHSEYDKEFCFHWHYMHHFVLFRICRHWRLVALLVWKQDLWAGYGGTLQNNRTPL